MDTDLDILTTGIYISTNDLLKTHAELVLVVEVGELGLPVQVLTALDRFLLVCELKL